MTWPLAEMRDLVLEAKPGFACGEDPPDGLFQFRMNNVRTDGSLDLSKKRRVAHTTRGVEAFMLQPGDVLFNATNSPELVGKSAFFPGIDEPAVFSNHFVRLRPSPAMDGRFLAHWLRLQYQRNVFARMCRRWVNQAAVPRDALLDLFVPAPPLPEQRRVAEILDRVDDLRVKRRLTIARLGDLTQARFLDMFGKPGPEWPMRTVNDIAEPTPGSIRTGPFGSQLLHSEFVSIGVPVLGIDNVVSNEFRWAKPRFITDTKYKALRRYTVRPGDVLITIMGTCGRCAVVPAGIPVAINTKHLCCITLDPSLVLPQYLHAYFLRHPLARRYLARMAKGAIMSGLNMAIIKAMPIPVPPLFLQQQFAEMLERVREAQDRLLTSLANLEALFISLQDRGFRGEL